MSALSDAARRVAHPAVIANVVSITYHSISTQLLSELLNTSDVASVVAAHAGWRVEGGAVHFAPSDDAAPTTSKKTRVQFGDLGQLLANV